MTKRRAKGNGTDEQTELLRGIWNEMKTLNSRIDKLRVEMHDGFKTVEKRVDNLLLGDHGREHAEFRARMTRVEEHLGLKPQ